MSQVQYSVYGYQTEDTGTLVLSVSDPLEEVQTVRFILVYGDSTQSAALEADRAGSGTYEKDIALDATRATRIKPQLNMKDSSVEFPPEWEFAAAGAGAGGGAAAPPVASPRENLVAVIIPHRTTGGTGQNLLGTQGGSGLDPYQFNSGTVAVETVRSNQDGTYIRHAGLASATAHARAFTFYGQLGFDLRTLFGMGTTPAQRNQFGRLRIRGDAYMTFGEGAVGFGGKWGYWGLKGSGIIAGGEYSTCGIYFRCEGAVINGSRVANWHCQLEKYNGGFAATGRLSKTDLGVSALEAWHTLELAIGADPTTGDAYVEFWIDDQLKTKVTRGSGTGFDFNTDLHMQFAIGVYRSAGNNADSIELRTNQVPINVWYEPPLSVAE